MKSFKVFCDFDGTITTKDTLNTFLREFAPNEWLGIEEKWESGKIGSKECIDEQMKLFNGFSMQKTDEFLSKVEIDPTFKEFFDTLKNYNIDFFIVSDGLDYFIEKILEINNIKNITIYSNKLLKNENCIIGADFPYTDPDCEKASGMCKCNIIKQNNTKNDTIIYIGDGASDFCVSTKVDVLFAKLRLLDYYKKNSAKYVNQKVFEFRNFNDIKTYILECIKQREFEGNEYVRT